MNSFVACTEVLWQMTDGPGLEEKFVQDSGKSAAAVMASFVLLNLVPAAGMATGTRIIRLHIERMW